MGLLFDRYLKDAKGNLIFRCQIVNFVLLFFYDLAEVLCQDIQFRLSPSLVNDELFKNISWKLVLTVKCPFINSFLSPFLILAAAWTIPDTWNKSQIFHLSQPVFHSYIPFLAPDMLL